MTLEEYYITSVSLEHRKKFAQFFTPEIIAEFMCDWVLKDCAVKNILEPAYGLGIFSRIISKINDANIDAYEIDGDMISYAQTSMPSNVNLNNADYLKSDWNKNYDAIICNPPYFKFHDYDNSKYITEVNQHLNIRLNGFTNIYTLFLLKSISQLNEGGKLAYIVPSEFLNSDYGVEVKRALLQSETLRQVIVIDYKKCAFDDALTTSCILFCQKGKPSENVRFSTIYDAELLKSSIEDFKSVNVCNLNPELKWKMFYEDRHSTKYHDLVPFSKFAKVSRGIATGSNDYFTFKESKKIKYKIKNDCFLPCICHSVDVDNLIFTEKCFKQLADNDKTVFLFNGRADILDSNVKNYIIHGENMKINEKYLTATRKPWYALENREPSPIWVSVFNRNGLKFVRNKAGVYNLTTFHCVYNKENVDTDILFAYLITDVAKEIFLDNSRQYGNGLVKFEPNDLNKGKVVNLLLLTEEEKKYVKEIYQLIENDSDNQEQYISRLNEFFKKKYTGESIISDSFDDDLNHYKSKRSVIKPRIRKVENSARQLSLVEELEG